MSELHKQRRREVNTVNRLVTEFIQAHPVGNWRKRSTPLEERLAALVLDGCRKFKRGLDTPQLRKECEERTVALDATLRRDVSNAIAWTNPNLMNQVRDFLYDALKPFKLSFADAWVGPGETYESRHGDVSSFSKLSGNWTVTANCLELGIEMMLENRQIRREIAKTVQVTGQEAQVAFREALLARFQVVPGGRFSCVLKDDVKMRPIEVQPLVNLMLQRCLHAVFARANNFVDNDIETGQARHRTIIKRRDVATWDGSDASNCISMSAVRDLFPWWVVRWIEQTRTELCEYPDGSLRQNRRVSSMGSYITFGLMTLLLKAIAHCVSPRISSTYGDDVIVARERYHDFVAVVSEVGFLTNHQKSFWEGETRESCGSYIIGDISVTRYDWHWCSDSLDAVLLLNKIQRLATAPSTPHQLSVELLSLHEKVKAVLADAPSGPPLASIDDDEEMLPGWIEDLNERINPEKINRYWSYALQKEVINQHALQRVVATEHVCEGGYLAYMIFLRDRACPTRYNKNKTTLQVISYLVSEGRILGRKKE